MTKTEPEKFFVRPLEKTDAPAISRWFEDLEDLALFDRCNRVPLNLEATEEAWADAFGNDGKTGKYWFTIEDGAQNAVGIVGLENVSLVNGDAVLPVIIARSVRKKGVGIRSAALVMDIAFRQLRLNRLTSYYRSDNDVSRYLIELAGFREEGCMRQAWFTNGEHVDMMVVGILRNEWMERRKKLASELDSKTIVTFGRDSSPMWSWPPYDDTP